MSDKKQVIFVDDEPRILDGLRRMLRRMRSEWEMRFVGGGVEALAMLDEAPADVIVTDMRMPDMNGAQLLEEVRKRYPQMVRVVLSGHTSQELILRSVGAAHRFLSKPCDADTLIATIKRGCALRQFLSDQIVTSIVAQIETLPVLPRVYTELVDALVDEKTSVNEIGSIVSRDIGLTTKVLQLVNSAFFGLRHHVDDPNRAVFFLGLDTLKSLVLSVSVFSAFEEDAMDEYSIEALQEHCFRVGALARKIAADHGEPAAVQDDAFTAGLLHDVGKLILIANFPAKFTDVLKMSREQHVLPVDVEQEILGVTHAMLGGYLISLWGLPDPIVEAVLLHSVPFLTLERAFTPLAAVHIANQLDHELTWDEADLDLVKYDSKYLADLGLQESLPRWRDLAASMMNAKEELSHASA